MTRAESTYAVTAKARQSYAEELFDIETVSTALLERAKAGFRSYRIIQVNPFDLTETDAARKLEKWLEQEDFRVVWRPAYHEPDPLRPSTNTEYLELVVFW
ncbi:hypothetical protein [Oricola sp.]|uniref:hypothetical protein n=1 Tax=Oricola sp. TaxID=1979950 RepID=UPI0025F3447C|nr:hypothetical protein [Oricola sp.]MCI5076854.1 hypothetical protein [Oricola sp.]